MKMVKKFLSASVIAAMALSVGMIANAEEVDTTVTADAITIDSITFSEHATDDTLVTATVAFTAVDTAEEVTILMSTEATVSDNAKIMYINQVAQPEDGVITFAIEKARILAAKGEGATDINNTDMYVKMGGTDIDTMASKTGTILFEEDYIPGDVDGNGRLAGRDATFALQLIAKWTVEEVQAKAPAGSVINAKAADVDGNGRLAGKDGTLLKQKLAGWEVTLVKPAN